MTYKKYNKEYSKGSGFVTFADREAFELALQKNRLIALDGRKLYIWPSRFKSSTTLFIRHIPQGSDPQELMSFFHPYNPIYATIKKYDTEFDTGFGFVRFSSPIHKIKALDHSYNLIFNGINIFVENSKIDIKPSLIRRAKKLHHKFIL